MSKNAFQKVLPTVVGLGILVGGFGGLTAYSYRAGEALPVAEHHVIRISEELLGEKGRSVLVLFYHPRCPCTSATVEAFLELDTLAAKDTTILAYSFLPDQAEESWIESDLTRTLRKVPDIRIELDRGGRMAQRHGATTSGYVLFVNERGEISFQGGLTSSRGHYGSSSSQKALARLLNGESITKANWPTFGCAISSRTVSDDNKL